MEVSSTSKITREEISASTELWSLYRLVVELDGDAHRSFTRDAYEDERTKYLGGLGLRVIRFENRDLLENLDCVLAAIMNELRTET